MKKLTLVLAVFGVPVCAQVTFTITCAPNPARAGAQITCPITVTGAPTATQGTITVGTGSYSLDVGSAAESAQKQIASSMSTNQFLVYGINQTIIANGPMAVITFTMPASSVRVGVSSGFAADANGGALTVTTNPLVTVALRSNCDINSDGQIDQSDVTSLAQQILSAPPSTAVNASTLQKVINASLPNGVCAL